MSRTTRVHLIRWGLLAAMLVAPKLGHAHEGHGDRAPWDACDEHELGATCAWDGAHHDRYIGTCREVSETLVCVRNKPIVPAQTSASGARLTDIFVERTLALLLGWAGFGDSES